jgi:hypothetical protein
MDRGSFCLEGMDSSILQKYELVMSGHFHHKSSKGNILYVGTPYELTWADYNDGKGFHIFDTKTRELTFVPNPNNMFHKIKYSDESFDVNRISSTDFSYLSNKYVKIVIEKKDQPFLLDMLVDKISKANPTDLTIVEDFDLIKETEQAEVNEAEDTLTILSKYVDGLTLNADSSKIKNILREIYTEALTTETP